MAYIAHTETDRKRILDRLGCHTFEDLVAAVPENIRLDTPLDVAGALPEWEVKKQLSALANKNRNTDEMVSFLGGGAYDHFIPSAVSHITRRSEFATAYTPYQPEVSQGTLQAIFEFQTAIARMVGLPIANASLYDGATACAEAALVSLAQTGGRHVVVSEAVHPHTRSVIATYLSGRNAKPRVVKTPGGATDPEYATAKLGNKPACLLVSQPNVFGQVEDISALAKVAHDRGALLVVCVDPVALGLLEAPGLQGADIVVGEGQSLGLAQSFGGPYLGFFAAGKELLRRLPGRLVGLSVDAREQRSYVMTLQTREQHIRRERATSNICTNQGLCALAATVYLSLVGKSGLVKAAQLCLQKAHYLADQLSDLTGFRLRYSGSFFKEFVLEGPTSPTSLIRKLGREGILPGIDLGRLQSSWRGGLLVAVTEKRTRGDMDAYVDLLRPFEARAAITEALARQLERGRSPEVPDTGEQSNSEAEASLQQG